MSKKALFKANLLFFIGGNIANALNFALNIALVKIDKNLLNEYTAYTSISLILLVPSLVTMRIFTVFGNPIIVNIQRSLRKNKNRTIASIILFSLLLIPFNYFLTTISTNGTWITSSLLIALAIVGFVANIFRGIQQNEENNKIAVISLNMEAAGRLILGFIFAIPLKMGISGVLLGHVLGLVASMIVCFEYKHINSPLEHNDEVRLRNLFLNTFFMTIGLEFFSNFDIIYTNYILGQAEDVKAEFNTLSIFRKIIFFGIFSISSVYLSVGGKNRFTKKFLFTTSVVVSFIISIGLGGFFFLFKDFIFEFLDQDMHLITNKHIIVFLISTTLMSTAYLLSNWLFTLKKNIFIYLPLAASLVQTLVFIIIGKDLYSLLNAFLITSIIFFGITFGVGFVEIMKKEAHKHG